MKSVLANEDNTEHESTDDDNSRRMTSSNDPKVNELIPGVSDANEDMQFKKGG